MRCPGCGHEDTRVVDSREAEDGHSIRRRKLASAIGKAGSKALTSDNVDRLIDDLESTIKQSGTSEVASQRIGEMVLERLAESDPMSYLRFKIVYSGLQDTEALYDELELLVRRRQDARDRRVAEQTMLPISAASADVPLAAGARRRRR